MAEDSYKKNTLVDGKPVVLNILDTSGQDNYVAMRDEWIRDGKGFLVVFAINDEKTFENAEAFVERIRKLKETVPTAM